MSGWELTTLIALGVLIVYLFLKYVLVEGDYYDDDNVWPE